MMLQQPSPDDYVIATGETHSVREFAERAFDLAGLDYRDCIMIDPTFFRPAEVDLLQGNAAKARAALGWTPSVTFHELVTEMVLADSPVLRTGATAPVR
jgi:GDPmannose 4,6-dehydratase